ncbi:tyrosine-protein phosphatase non-receptor type 5 [Lingula anatina]|uniref:protein-tyrosine-phosphatase n=1 Tax=Lingula anatina TaxID=7574 RepID=A0A1S3HV46_LINAN|nr:tyrosine-protein phosphatase non-receptor type 5 [Lingula anatina]|eukprot:XP_013389915.1 tyrosine-protein phosphatase non-receptor type 5 [Lingula anatina]
MTIELQHPPWLSRPWHSTSTPSLYKNLLKRLKEEDTTPTTLYTKVSGLGAGDQLWTQWYVWLAFGLGALLVAVTIVIVVCCCVHKRKKKRGEMQVLAMPQQICIYQGPSPKSAVHSTTYIQPGTDSSCTSSTASSTPKQSPSISPKHKQISRVKAKSLIERRGSNNSLTLDLSLHPDNQNQRSPTRERCNEEYLATAGNRMSRSQLRHCLKNVKALYEEFWEIPMNHSDKVEIAGSGTKNRYRTIIPNESTRVKLEEVDGDPLTTYINANYVRGYAGEEKTYIATQGPMAHTVHDFWKMIWQEKVPIIVMITKLKEKDRSKCESYLPVTQGEYSGIHVTVQDTEEHEGFTLRRLLLQKNEEKQIISHYWYTSWPDHKAPETARQLLDLATLVEQQRQDLQTKAKVGPVVVHCSAGIGRTGCFIGTSIGMRQLEEEDALDILGIVCQMRRDRGGMVQTNEQYEFLHRALCLYEQQIEHIKKKPSG